MIVLNVLLVARGKPPIDISLPVQPLLAVIIVFVLAQRGVTISIGRN